MYAIFLRKYKDGLVALKDCYLVYTEADAQWYCILNPQYTYRKIEG